MNFRFVANNVQVLSVDENKNSDGSIVWYTVTIFDASAKRMCTLTADRLVALNVAVGDCVDLLVDCTESAKLSANSRAAYIDNKFKAVGVVSSSGTIRFPRLSVSAPGSNAGGED